MGMWCGCVTVRHQVFDGHSPLAWAGLVLGLPSQHGDRSNILRVSYSRWTKTSLGQFDGTVVEAMGKNGSWFPRTWECALASSVAAAANDDHPSCSSYPFQRRRGVGGASSRVAVNWIFKLLTRFLYVNHRRSILLRIEVLCCTVL